MTSRESSVIQDVRVWGDYACFTRPETKAERVSYPILTPSAARNIMRAIMWKPEMEWRIREIWLLRPIQWFNIVRNEVISRITAPPRPGEIYYADDDRSQRSTLGLRKVAYLIRASVVIQPHASGASLFFSKYQEQLQKRLDQGACAWTPYLGCREFSADFGNRRQGEMPYPITRALGQMLHDIDYSDPENKVAHFFDANLVRGVMAVPELPF